MQKPPYAQRLAPEVNEQKNLPGPVTSQTTSAFYLQLVHCFTGYSLSWSPPLLLSHTYFLLTMWPCPKRPQGAHTGLWEQLDTCTEQCDLESLAFLRLSFGTGGDDLQ